MYILDLFARAFLEVTDQASQYHAHMFLIQIEAQLLLCLASPVLMLWKIFLTLELAVWIPALQLGNVALKPRN